MSYTSGRFVAGFILFFSGVIIIILGLILSFTPFSDEVEFIMARYAMLFGGLVAAILGAIVIPGGRRESRNVNRIIEIVAVEKEATFSEISERTGLEPEYIRKIITQLLTSGFLVGYIENDTFMRNTSARPERSENGQMGLFGG